MVRDQEILTLEKEIPYLRRFARARVGDPDYADDLVQACLEKAVINFDKYKPGTNLRAWLLCILRNHQISEYRKQRRRPDNISFDEMAYVRPVDATQSQSIEFKEFVGLFRRLSETDQEILLLVGVEGLAYEEAAKVLGVAVGTVRSRLSRARTKLKSLQETADSPKQRFNRSYGLRAPLRPNALRPNALRPNAVAYT
jgi:RNA polymerase sigma-70 factor (ECF subfamily)